jgi:hypothetical protein
MGSPSDVVLADDPSILGLPADPIIFVPRRPGYLSTPHSPGSVPLSAPWSAYREKCNRMGSRITLAISTTRLKRYTQPQEVMPLPISLKTLTETIRRREKP